jgi:hypothetical protein
MSDKVQNEQKKFADQLRESIDTASRQLHDAGFVTTIDSIIQQREPHLDAALRLECLTLAIKEINRVQRLDEPYNLAEDFMRFIGIEPVPIDDGDDE